MANVWLKDIAAGAAEGIDNVRNLLSKVDNVVAVIAERLDEAEDYVHQFTGAPAESGPVEEDDSPSLVEQVLKSYDRYLRVVSGYDEKRRATYLRNMRETYSKWTDTQLRYEMGLWDQWADEADRKNHI